MEVSWELTVQENELAGMLQLHRHLQRREYVFPLDWQQGLCVKTQNTKIYKDLTELDIKITIQF